ncbi:hypothetical protein NCAS_0A15150 [Naumovozyma castellii]|uniref:DNA polymerase epsilon subunit B n=1 Tax=Naumovozyma castellii TaxID=27288 RepID=G0V9C2_NAUCA|nr:hypothetical protein NCAS_0A15150 [Naumovozyma castellii CBS 4309]CCC68073.1 hypothetical protein NCAS_0A15150 [Naumovozyma castellii CBS 4309]
MFTSGKVLPVKIQPPLLRPLAYRVLSKKYGLSIKSDGLSALAEFVGNTMGSDWKRSPETLNFLELFASVWKQQERGLFVDKAGVLEVVCELKEREKTNIQESTQQRDNNKGTNDYSRKGKTLDNFLTGAANNNNLEENESLNSDTSDLMLPHNSSLSPIPLNESDLPMDLENDELPENNTHSQQQQQQLNWKDYFKVINVSEQQKFTYNANKMQFQFCPINTNTSVIKLPTTQTNVTIFPTRYYLIRDRVMRNENFQNDDTFNPLSSMMHLKEELQESGGNVNITSFMSITPIKNLLGRDGMNFLLLGLLKKNTRGNWALEDPSGSIEIEISQTIPTKGLYYVPGCIVLAEGIYFSVGNKFHVTSMTHPPGERRETTLEAIGNLDLLGVHGASNENYIARLDNDLKIRLHFLEKELEDHRFVILGGDLFLDELATLEALKKTFTKLEEDPPTLLIFQGSFTSVPVHASMTSRNVSATTQYKNNFDTLAGLLSTFENIINGSTLIFIPGPNDPWSSMVSLGATGIFPQKPIPTYFTQKMNRVCKHIIWGSNPTRIAYLSQEVVISRDNLVERFKRNSVIFPTVEETREQRLQEVEERLQNISIDETVSIDELVKDKDQKNLKVQETRKIVKTILDQGHLSPFTTNIRPLFWDLDYSLTLYPIPTTLIMCDTSAPQFDLTYNGCKSINPGRFIIKRRARYLEYKPSQKTVVQQEVYF